MGIPSYFSYIVQNFPNIIKKLENSNITVHHLYMDCNSIIYDVVNQLNKAELNTNNIITNVIKIIDNYVNLLKPINNVFIAFDGVAPVAKLQQQRERRYKSWYQNIIYNKIFNGEKIDAWNTTAITPGTVFMKELNDTINNYYKNKKNFILSTSYETGEGEHKIFEFIRNNKNIHENKNTVIYGLDADLIMLSINHLPICPYIYLFRETPHFIQSINRDLEPNKNYILDISELSNIITRNMNNLVNTNECQENHEKQNYIKNEIISKNKVYDYIFLCFFLGNDFLPHFPSINIRTGGTDKMVNAYKATIFNENIFNGEKINWKMVRKLVLFLAENEEKYFQMEYNLRNKKEKFFYSTDTPENFFKKWENIPSYERQMEKYINPNHNGWEERYYKILFKIEYKEDRLKQICINYLEGLEWTMKYYTSGCPDWRWKYNYHYPPLLKDLIKFIPYFDTNLIKTFPKNPVSPLVQLCYVIPKPSLSLLPAKLQELLLLNHDDWYNTNSEFIWAFCKYFWESHVDLPEIDMEVLENFIHSNFSLIQKE